MHFRANGEDLLSLVLQAYYRAYDFHRRDDSMYIRKPLLVLALAGVALLVAFPLTVLRASAQQTDDPTAAHPLIRRFSIRNLGSFEKIDPAEIQQRLRDQGLLPAVEKPYDQETVDEMAAAIREMYQERGIDVAVDAIVQPTRSPRYVLLSLTIRKK
jgi:hypothetical protein